MSFRFAGRKNIGPLRLNFGKKGLTSLSLKAGPATIRLWSKNGAGARLTSIDTPGFGSIRL